MGYVRSCCEIVILRDCGLQQVDWFLIRRIRAGSNYRKSLRLQLLTYIKFNYNYTSMMLYSITITPYSYRLQLYHFLYNQLQLQLQNWTKPWGDHNKSNWFKHTSKNTFFNTNKYILSLILTKSLNQQLTHSTNHSHHLLTYSLSHSMHPLSHSVTH